MTIFDVLTMLGGLAMFLYGMETMGDGLAKMAGSRLEKILERLTSSTLRGVLLGLGVTAVIQSSSATTVMVVGFVNSGIMKLSQTVGIIMGANVGTTVTSWILSLASIEGSNIFLQLLKPSSFSPVLAVIGIGLKMFSKESKHKDIADILLGFAILMFGMETMSDAVKPLRDVPEFTNLLLKFSNPVLGMLVGALITAVIQSSSASVGILQALCMTGSVPFATAVPIIMGQNIGTCVTALISGIGASKNAKRASFVHLYFNVIGTLLFMIVFYAIHFIHPFAFLDRAATAGGIAAIHSAFNITATIVLLPFGNLLVKLAALTVRDKELTAQGRTEEEEEKSEIPMLDSRFLDTPAFAIEQCRNATVQMAEISKKALLLSMGLLDTYKEETAAEVVHLENMVDAYEDQLGSYLVKLSSRELTMHDSNTLSLLLHCIGDYERISDHAVNIQEAAKEMYEKKISFSKKALSEIRVFSKALTDIAAMAVDAFEHENMEEAKSIEPMEEVIDDLNTELKQRHIERLRRGKCTIELGFILSDLLTDYERIADHCSNIACNMIEIRQGGYERHSYKESVKSGNNLTFAKDYHFYKEQYPLPKSGLTERE